MESFRSMVAARCIKRELEEIQSKPSDDFKCLALKGNPFDWQFAIRGSNGTEFEGGIYHGRIQFSEEYPNKPPIFTLLTENGRFKTQTEIDLQSPYLFAKRSPCVRDALHKLTDLLPTYPDGKSGSVEYDKEKRRALAMKSRGAPPKYGNEQRQKLIEEIDEYMRSKARPVPANRGGNIRVTSQNDRGKRKRGENFQNCTGSVIHANNSTFFIGNRIHANNSSQAGIFDFENKRSKKAKQVDYSGETSSTSREDNQE